MRDKARWCTRRRRGATPSARSQTSGYGNSSPRTLSTQRVSVKPHSVVPAAEKRSRVNPPPTGGGRHPNDLLGGVASHAAPPLCPPPVLVTAPHPTPRPAVARGAVAGVGGFPRVPAAAVEAAPSASSLTDGLRRRGRIAPAGRGGGPRPLGCRARAGVQPPTALASAAQVRRAAAPASSDPTVGRKRPRFALAVIPDQRAHRAHKRRPVWPLHVRFRTPHASPPRQNAPRCRQTPHQPLPSLHPRPRPARPRVVLNLKSFDP